MAKGPLRTASVPPAVPLGNEDPPARELAVEFGFLSGTTLFCQASNLFASLYVARVLGPSQFGIWAALLVATSYGPLFTCGVLNAMALEIPLQRGRRQLDGIADVAAAGALSIGLVIAGGSVAGLIYGYVGVSGIARTAVWATIPYFAVYLCQTYIQSYLRAEKRFSLISWQQAVLGAGFLLFAIPLTSMWGLPGYIFGMTAAVGLSSLVGSIHVRPRVAVRHFYMLPSLARIGIPIVTVGAVHIILYTLDRWIVLWVLGAHELGIYAFAVRIASVSLLLAGVLADQNYPRMAEAHGRSGRIWELRKYVDRQLVWTALLLIPGVVVAGIAAGPVTRAFFPQYVPTLRVLQIYLFGYVMLGLVSPFGVLLNVIQRQRIYLTVQVCVLVALPIVLLLLARLGLGLEGIAIGCSLAYCAYFVAIASISYSILFSARRRASAAFEEA